MTKFLLFFSLASVTPVHIYIFQRDNMDMDANMTAWWSFDQSQPFFSLTSVTLPALLAIVLMVFGGLAYILQVLAEGLKFIHIWRLTWD